MTEKIHRGLATAVCETICIALWKAQPTEALFLEQKSQLDKTVAEYPGEAKFLCVVEEQAPPPEEPIRKASSKMIESHEGNLVRVACVIEGEGFRAAITRAVLSGMGMVVRGAVPIRYFENTEDAARWLVEPRLGRARRVVAIVETLREKLAAHPAA